MANFYIPPELVAAMCERISIHMEYLITSSSQLLSTFLDARPDKSEVLSDVFKALRRGVRSFVATDMSLLRLSKSKHGLDAVAWKALISYWNAIRRRVSKEKNNIILKTVIFMMNEIKHLYKYQGLFSYFWCDGYQKINNHYKDQLEYGNLVLQIDYFLGNFAINSYLFLHHLPQLLNPNRFFATVDGIYYYATRFFATLIEKGNGPDNFILYRLARNFIGLGPICPKSKLGHPSADAWIKSMEEYSGEVLEEEYRQYYTLMYTLAVDPDKFSDLAKYISSLFEARQRVNFYSSYYALVLFELIVRDIIVTIKKLYFKIRRIIYSILLHVCHKEHLAYMVRGALKGGVSIYLNDCTEILYICKKTMNEVRVKSYTFETATRVIWDDGYLGYKPLYQEGPKLCKTDVLNYLRRHYEKTRKELLREAILFLLRFSSLCGHKGIDPVRLNNVYSSVHLGLSVCQKLCYQMERAVQEFQGRRVVFIKDTNDILPYVRKFFLVAYKKIDSMPATGQRLNPNAILRQIPLNAELRSMIVKHKKANIFHGNEPVLPPPNSEPVQLTLKKIVLDIDSVTIPEEDTLTENELREIFENI